MFGCWEIFKTIFEKIENTYFSEYTLNCFAYISATKYPSVAFYIQNKPKSILYHLM